MSHEKNPIDDDNTHALGTGAGAAAGAVAGAAVGAPGGPVGMAIGALAGGLIGAGAGESLARTADVEDYRAHLLRDYTGAEYYRPGQEWSDYEPAYDFAFEQFDEYHGEPLADVEQGMRRDWEDQRVGRPERPAWEQARPAVAHGWDYLREHALAAASGKHDAR